MVRKSRKEAKEAEFMRPELIRRSLKGAEAHIPYPHHAVKGGQGVERRKGVEFKIRL